MIVRSATLQDLKQIAQLEINNLHDEHQLDASSKQGQSFSLEQLTTILNLGLIYIAEVNTNIIGYVLVAPWSFFNKWSIYKKIYQQLPTHNISQKQSCQYGPIWVNEAYRGKNVFQPLFEAVKQQALSNYQHMVTFIAEDNERSFRAHTKNDNMKVLDFFEMDDRGYYLLASS
ncbi:GNAT family N-acetyltransferase [Parashewanella curva]|uniref:GNAT family N-acetyltransferase n=1 Tax=Parashewanella curva TaxID=2338552 RepID=A0A3L8Q1A4_9GAMM|nr:GNAT family N-acetyltransferase [Parashewanella curva]RLV61354.1 GNAT family N-acetyltransferase [Parashewanella curva]